MYKSPYSIFTLSVGPGVYTGVLRNQAPNDWRECDAWDFDFSLLICGVVSLEFSTVALCYREFAHSRLHRVAWKEIGSGCWLIVYL